MTVPNYKQAIHTLKERYANPQMLISSHMESSVKLPSIKNANNVVGLRKIYDQVESSVRNLKSLGIHPESYGSLLTPLLTEKLPSELRMIIARKFTDDIWKLEERLNYFKEELQAKERCTSVGINSSTNTHEKSSDFRSTTSSFFVNGKSGCVYCRGPYSPSKCSKMTNISARRGILRKYARCFICLKNGHISKNCVSDYKCNKCGKRHHISLCDHVDIKRDDPKSETTVNVNNNKNNVLLQTAQGYV